MSFARLKVASVIALVLPMSLLACEEKGIPAPNADIVQPVPTATEAADAKPADSAAADDKQAKADAVDDKGDDKGDDPADDKGDDDKGDEAKAGASDATKTADATAKADPKADTKPAPKEAEPEPTKGEKKTAGSYAAWLQSSGKYTVDKPGAVVAVVNAQGEFKCNDKYPYKFKVGSAPAGVSFASTTVRGASIGKKSTSLRIPFTPTSKGAKTISGTFYFSVCNAETCQIKKQPMSVTVNVE